MSEEDILKVKSILGPKTIIAGSENYEEDMVYYIIEKELFESILKGNLYIENKNIYPIITIKQIWNYISWNINIILSRLRKDPYIQNDQYFKKYIKIVEHAIISYLFLQTLENTLYKNESIREIILDNEALAFISTYKYLKEYIRGPIRIPMPIQENKEEEKESIEMLLRIYKVISKYDLTMPKGLRNLYNETIKAILDNNNTNIENELKLIKKYIAINKKAKLRKKIIKLKREKKELERQIRLFKAADPSDPEIQELEKEKEEIEKELEKLTKKKQIVKENVQNENEKAKTKPEELENKNGQ